MTYVLVHCPDCQVLMWCGTARHLYPGHCFNKSSACSRRLSLRVPEPRPPSCSETTDGGHGPQWQWDPRYCPCFKGQSDDRHQHP